MATRMKTISWMDQGRLSEQFRIAQLEDANYVVLERESGQIPLQLVDRAASEFTNSQATQSSPAPIIVCCYPAAPARKKRLRQLLTPVANLMVSLPDQDLAIAIPVNAVSISSSSSDSATSVCEQIIRLAESIPAIFVEAGQATPTCQSVVPQLTMPPHGPRALWLKSIIERAQLTSAKLTPTSLTALKSGLYLINDFFDESHSYSQSIEGLGPHRSGDYWHAILHRREPDYGNAKYWFRNVGRHPIFVELNQAVRMLLTSTRGTLANKLEHWRARLLNHDEWDPFAFVDLCCAAETDDELRGWCEQVQFEEMLLLLEATVS